MVVMIFQDIFMASGWFLCFFQGIFMVFHLLLFTIITITIAIFFVRPLGQMFLRFIDHCMGLFLMVDKHRSSNVMFAMYCSSL